MNRKIILTCAAAVAALGLALAPVTASAKGHSSHHSHHGHHGKHSHAHHHHKHHHMHHAHHHHKKHHHKHHWHHYKHYKYYYPKNYYYEEDTTTSTPSYSYEKPSYVYSKPAPSCTCLTKEYAPDGTVVFKDVCTKEMAVSEPSSTKAETEN